MLYEAGSGRILRPGYRCHIFPLPRARTDPRPTPLTCRRVSLYVLSRLLEAGGTEPWVVRHRVTRQQALRSAGGRGVQCWRNGGWRPSQRPRDTTHGQYPVRRVPGSAERWHTSSRCLHALLHHPRAGSAAHRAPQLRQALLQCGQAVVSGRGQAHLHGDVLELEEAVPWRGGREV